MKDIKYKAYRKVLGKYAMERSFIKHVVAEDGTEFRMIAFSFIDGTAVQLITLVEAIEADYIDVVRSAGLKDKNKEEIFEGDIIRVVSTFDDIHEVCVQEVKWAEEGGYFCEEEAGYDLMPALGNEQLELEIIGNIYENPELLSND